MKYYFASRTNRNGETLHPKVPENRMISEDAQTRRICVSQSINGCLTAIGGFDTNDIVHIHECESNTAIQPTIEQVPDVCFTGEMWITHDIVLKHFMTLKVHKGIATKICNMSNALYAITLEEESK